MLELKDTPPDKADYIVQVSGDSMEPVYFDREYVFVEKCDSIDIRDVGIFVNDSKVYIKEYKKDGLHSYNRKYKTIPGHQEIKCLGRVIGRVKGLK